MDRPGVRQVSEGSGQQGKMEEAVYEVIYGATTTLAVKEQMKEKKNVELLVQRFEKKKREKKKKRAKVTRFISNQANQFANCWHNCLYQTTKDHNKVILHTNTTTWKLLFCSCFEQGRKK